MPTAEPAEPDQRAAIAFLADPANHGEKRVERFETHGNLVFLAGASAFKIKRAVRFDYMDFSTLEKRRIACRREVEINRRWAPELYLGCVPIKQRTDGTLAFGGDGEVVEWAIHMRRFQQSDLLSTRAADNQVDAKLAGELADTVYASHQVADRVIRSSAAGIYRDLVQSVVGALAKSAVYDVAALERLSARLQRQLDRVSAIIDQRAAHGFLRRCHGDLHLANVVLRDGRPVLYDAIEFDDDLATIDTLYDLAFLLMDLDFQNLRPAANVVLNRYLWRSRSLLDMQGLAALPLFLALRAAIRARVTIDRARQKTGLARTGDFNRARQYFDAAIRYAEPQARRLIAVGGLSGTGKTTLAAALAPIVGSAPGAVHLRSDLERKALAGVGEFERLPAKFYTSEARRRTYAVLHEKAERVIGAHHSVIVDAVYDSEADRRDLEDLALNLGVRLQAVWLEADPSTLLARVDARRNDASDATRNVVHAQLAAERGPLSSSWTSVHAGGGVAQTLQAAKVACGLTDSSSDAAGDVPAIRGH